MTSFIAPFFTIFITVFLAEIGDKTQLSTVFFATEDGHSKWLVFSASTAALATSTAIAVLLGAAADRWLALFPLKLLAGLGFLVIGVLLLVEHMKTA